MLIQCHQLTIKNVMLRKQPASAPYGSVVSDALHVTPQRGTIDVFRAYYDAATTSHTAQQAPHYQFANLKNFEDVVMFLQCFGLPGCPGSAGRQDILLGEFLIAAKRLRYAMEARAALIQGDEERAQASLAKLGFALDCNAHWYFWPAPINPEFEKVDDMTWQERFMEFMQSMARQEPHPPMNVGSHEWKADIVRRYPALGLRDPAVVGAGTQARHDPSQEHGPGQGYAEFVAQLRQLCPKPLIQPICREPRRGVEPTPEVADEIARMQQESLQEHRPGDVFAEYARQIQSLCAEPLGRVEITPALRAKGRKVELRWSLHPVEFLGEEDMGHGSITYEELHFESPYLLMFMEDVSQDSAIRVCADQSCKRLFEPKRGDQMYCNQTCAGRTSSRNYRKRQSKPPGE